MPIKGAEKIKLEKTLRDVTPGEIVYTIPNSLYIDRTGSAYLDLTQVAMKRKIGLAILQVKRLSFKQDDYEVNVDSLYKSNKYYKWTITNFTELPKDDFAYLGKVPESVLVDKKQKKPASK